MRSRRVFFSALRATPLPNHFAGQNDSLDRFGSTKSLKGEGIKEAEAGVPSPSRGEVKVTLPPKG